MVKDRQVFKYRGKDLIEKITIQPPFHYDTIFHNEGCFIYVKGASTKLLSSEVNLELQDREAVLLKCGSYFADWIKESANEVMVVAVHLYPEVLKHLYMNELPRVFSQRSATDQVKKIVPDDVITKFVDTLEFYFDNPGFVNEDFL